MKKTFTAGGNTIAYRVTGQGDPVMLVHGFGEDSSVWNGTIQHLKEYFLLIVPDLPGSGESVMDEHDWSMDRFAGILKDILDREKITTCSMIGHSMGGYITLAFAEHFPGYLSGFGLFHSTAFADSEEKVATRRKGIEFIRKHGAAAFLESTTPNLFSPGTKENKPGIMDSILRLADNFTAEALISYYEAMISRPDRTEVLRNSIVPVLFIIGKYDNAVSPTDMLKQSYMPSTSHIHILEQSGHMGMLEEAERSYTLLADFLYCS